MTFDFVLREARIAGRETETLDMFTHNEGARDEVAHVRKVDALTHGKAAPAATQHA